MERVENELREAIKGKDLQPCETGKFFVREQLAFDLKRSLLGREQDERRAIGCGGERGTDFREAAEGFSTASGTEEKARLHGEVLTQRYEAAKLQRFFPLEIYFSAFPNALVCAPISA